MAAAETDARVCLLSENGAAADHAQMSTQRSVGARLCDQLFFDHSKMPGGGRSEISLGDFKRRHGALPAPGALPSFLDATPGLRRKVVLMLSALAVANIGLIGAIVAVSSRYPVRLRPRDCPHDCMHGRIGG